ncbi:unnamed protein product [Rotaria magnacalcarata]|uniref:Uncharacterized protein n=1 Tax=Rotaria magnacalcarata TaxID=392030 RepID=A0A8S2Q241_9BILA|nr:unnamed protein product [Rotaria magnacalcarata]
MEQQNTNTESSSPSNDELEMHEVELIITTATTPESLSSSSHIPKTARDKFFEDLQREMHKKRWSAKNAYYIVSSCFNDGNHEWLLLEPSAAAPEKQAELSQFLRTGAH